MKQKKLSFVEIEKEVEKLVIEFNSKLVSTLNNCDEPIVLGLDPSFWRRNTFDECWQNPVTINIALKKNMPKNTTPIYSVCPPKP